MRLDEDRRRLADAVGDLAAKHAGGVREAMGTPLGYDPDLWAGMAAMGLPGIAVDEAHGGGGGALADLAVALEELGRRLLPSPLFATAALTAPLLQLSGDRAAMRRWLPGIAAGEVRGTVAWPGSCCLRLDDGCLTGTVTRLISGASADLIEIGRASCRERV